LKLESTIYHFSFVIEWNERAINRLTIQSIKNDKWKMRNGKSLFPADAKYEFPEA